jgi:hypothetical protein
VVIRTSLSGVRGSAGIEGLLHRLRPAGKVADPRQRQPGALHLDGAVGGLWWFMAAL